MIIDLTAPVVYGGQELREPVWDGPDTPRLDETGQPVLATVTIGDLLGGVIAMKQSENPLLMSRQDKVRIAVLEPKCKGETIELSATDADWIIERAITYALPIVLGILAETLDVDLAAHAVEQEDVA